MSHVILLVCFCLIFGGEFASARIDGRPGRNCDSISDICRYFNVTGMVITIDHTTYTEKCRCFSSEGPSEDNPPGCDWEPEGGAHGHADQVGMCRDMDQICLFIDPNRKGTIITWETSATFSCKCHSAEGPSESGPVGCNWEAPLGVLNHED